MKRISTYVGLLCSAFIILSVTSDLQGGIDFKKLTLKKAMEQADEEGKLIFIDAYTSWCGPCKQLEKTTFKSEKVGEAFNEQFINIKIDIEKDADGPEIERKYKVKAYPTLLVIDSEGKLKKSLVGFQTEKQMLSLAKAMK
jgi:thioredoxin 1